MGCRLAVRADANNNRTTPSSLLSREAQPHLAPVSQGQGGLVSQLGLVPVQQSPGEAAAVSSQGRKQRKSGSAMQRQGTGIPARKHGQKRLTGSRESNMNCPQSISGLELV